MSARPKLRWWWPHGLVDPEEIKTYDDLLAPGAEPGTMPTDLEQSTGLERLELLGKMEGVDVFDMKPLDSSRTGMFYFFFHPLLQLLC